MTQATFYVIPVQLGQAVTYVIRLSTKPPRLSKISCKPGEVTDRLTKDGFSSGFIDVIGFSNWQFPLAFHSFSVASGPVPPTGR